MNAKKLITALSAVLMLTAASASAAKTEKVIIPDYECLINDASVYYADSVYPLISFRNITYFPMTYEYCRALGLTSQWVEGKGLYIAYSPSSQNTLPVYGTQNNSKTGKAVIPDYPIYINGKKISNASTEYPLLNFRNVTYFPMTYDYATKEFNWATQWVPGKFTLVSHAGSDYTQLVIVRKDSDGAVLWSSRTVERQLENGEYTADSIDEYNRLDYKTGALSKTGAVDDDDENRREAQLTVDEKNGKVLWNGTEIEGDWYLKNALQNSDKKPVISVNGYIVTKNGIDIMYVTENLRWDRDDGSASMNKGTHCFLINNGKAVFIGNEYIIENAARLGNSIYIGARGYAQTIFKHMFSKSTLFRYDEGGAMTDITESFDSGYHSVKLIGEANGLLYLKCEWCPETVLYEGNYHEVAAEHDGYFTYDGNNERRITKVANYRYADEELLAPNGDIYALTYWNGKIQKVAD